jgi:isopentenyl phosphate kinase
MTTIVKLGGSVVTEKDQPETVDDETLDRVGAAIGEAITRESPTDLVVVHGGGSFGHHHAAAHGVSTTDGTHDTTAIRAIHRAMVTLNDAVLDALAEHGVDGVPVHPLSCALYESGDALSVPTSHVSCMLSEGFVPVLHGDVITHERKGATVVSGDDIVAALARSLSATRVGLCSTVPGVLDDNGDVIPTITAYEDVATTLGASEATDVTGGMARKVQTLLGLDTPASIFGPTDLDAFLAGSNPGTLVHRE